jgi:hypothetical protein
MFLVLSRIFHGSRAKCSPRVHHDCPRRHQTAVKCPRPTSLCHLPSCCCCGSMMCWTADLPVVRLRWARASPRWPFNVLAETNSTAAAGRRRAFIVCGTTGGHWASCRCDVAPRGGSYFRPLGECLRPVVIDPSLRPGPTVAKPVQRREKDASPMPQCDHGFSLARNRAPTLWG